MRKEKKEKKKKGERKKEKYKPKSKNKKLEREQTIWYLITRTLPFGREAGMWLCCTGLRR